MTVLSKLVGAVAKGTGTKPSHAAIITFLLGAGGAAIVSHLYGQLNAGKGASSASASSAKGKEVAAGRPRKGKGGDRVAIDSAFFERIQRLIKVCVPSIFSVEAGCIVLVAAMMACRTLCDLWVIRVTTSIESSIIMRDRNNFKKNMISFCLGMFPVSCVNSLLKFGLQEFALRTRVRLTRFLYERYLKGFTYYQLVNLDSRIQNPDQLLTQDVEKFCQGLADLYANVQKPLVDVIIYAVKLSNSVGAQGPLTMLLYLVISGAILTRLRRPLGRLTVEEQRLEGEFRAVNARLISASEEVAFYGGNERERSVINAAFKRLVNHLRGIVHFRAWMGIVDNVATKYCAFLTGFTILHNAFMNFNLDPERGITQDALMQRFYSAARMLINLGQAMGRLVLAGRDLTRLAGFTSRVSELINVFDDLAAGRYKRATVSNDSAQAASSELQTIPINKGKVISSDDLIRFEGVPIITPNGDVLIRSLDIEVRAGTNVLIAGPNGCGKSSLFRVLGELWPIFGGVLTKPPKEKIFYVPQRPLMSFSTLRDQITYPHSTEEMRSRGVTDSDLAQLLDQVQLGHLLEREGGWDSIQDWTDVLSGGEKQRVAMARLFYHKPTFAILDECTSAVSMDVEDAMYNRCKQLGITLFTVSHRKSLWKHHECVLRFDGLGGYKMSTVQEAEVYGS